MAQTIFSLSSDIFCIEADINGVTLKLRHGPHLFPAVLSDELVDTWIAQVVLELTGVAPEMKAELRKIREAPLFGDDHD